MAGPTARSPVGHGWASLGGPRLSGRRWTGCTSSSGIPENIHSQEQTPVSTPENALWHDHGFNIFDDRDDNGGRWCTYGPSRTCRPTPDLAISAPASTGLYIQRSTPGTRAWPEHRVREGAHVTLSTSPLIGEVPRTAATKEVVDQRLYDLDHDSRDRGEQLPALPPLGGRPIAAITAALSSGQSGSPPLPIRWPANEPGWNGRKSIGGHPAGPPGSADLGAVGTGARRVLPSTYGGRSHGSGVLARLASQARFPQVNRKILSSCDLPHISARSPSESTGQGGGRTRGGTGIRAKRGHGATRHGPELLQLRRATK